MSNYNKSIKYVVAYATLRDAREETLRALEHLKGPERVAFLPENEFSAWIKDTLYKEREVKSKLRTTYDSQLADIPVELRAMEPFVSLIKDITSLLK